MKHKKLGKKLSDFPFGEDDLNVENVTELYIAFKGEPSNNILADAFENGIYEKAFNPEAIEEYEYKKMAKEILLAYNVYNIIKEELEEINSLSKSVSQAISNTTTFKSIQEKARALILLSEEEKENFETLEIFMDRREEIKTHLKELSLLTHGEYHLLALFREIMLKCQYFDLLLELKTKNEIYAISDKSFLSEHVLKPILLRIAKRFIIEPNIKRFPSLEKDKAEKVFNDPESFSKMKDQVELEEAGYNSSEEALERYRKTFQLTIFDRNPEEFPNSMSRTKINKKYLNTLLGDNNIGQVFSILENKIEKSDYRELEGTLIIQRNNWKDAQDQYNMQIISNEEKVRQCNKVIQGLKSIIDDLYSN